MLAGKHDPENMSVGMSYLRNDIKYSNQGVVPLIYNETESLPGTHVEFQDDIKIIVYYIIPGYEIVRFAGVWSCVHDHTCWSWEEK